ncbi:MAG: CRISPR system precrRNA processing endoribonuclease RAMP protein Cas6 [Xanthomonadales bacterium]|nr:CRISPR system precrRNA processing endoribonuclease RAMP protein Cas6 [Xanthomonadales bacterium]
MRKYTSAPRPYVLLPDAGGTIEEGGRFGLELRLFGSANKHRDLVVQALERSAWKGLGKSRLRFESSGPVEAQINSLDMTPGKDLPVLSGDLRIQLLTPLRIRVRNHYVGPADLSFGDFFSILLRRLSMLCSFHEKRPFETDFRALVSQAHSIEWQEAALELVRLKRYSSRQHSALDMSGLSGRLSLACHDAEPFLPWLWLGQYTLLGRGCVMGLGQYTLDH